MTGDLHRRDGNKRGSWNGGKVTTLKKLRSTAVESMLFVVKTASPSWSLLLSHHRLLCNMDTTDSSSTRGRTSSPNYTQPFLTPATRDGTSQPALSNASATDSNPLENVQKPQSFPHPQSRYSAPGQNRNKKKKKRRGRKQGQNQKRKEKKARIDVESPTPVAMRCGGACGADQQGPRQT
jgi:hypothetical protein